MSSVEPVAARPWLLRVGAALAVLAGTGRGAEPPGPPWRPVAKQLLASEKPGFGGLCGVAVDRRNGDVYVDLSDRGIYRSRDRGDTWERCGKKDLKGRTEWPGCLTFDPTGPSGRMLAALVYGQPPGISTDRGATWKFMSPRASHVDWCAIDWTDPAVRFVLALRHESGGTLIASHDGGKTFADVGKGYGPAWVFDTHTAVVAAADRPELRRTTDGGKTWKLCGRYLATALPQWFGGRLFWLVDKALLVSTDRGATWQRLADVKQGRFGPVFGKDGRHLFVLTRTGILQSTDGGTSWAGRIALPREVANNGPLTWIAYDPVHDVLYAMRMGSDLYRLERPGHK